MIRVALSGPLRDSAQGAESVEVEARTIRELFDALVKQYPDMKPLVDRGIAVSINGRIFRDRRGEAIPPDAEVFLLPRIQGG